MSLVALRCTPDDGDGWPCGGLSDVQPSLTHINPFDPNAAAEPPQKPVPVPQ